MTNYENDLGEDDIELAKALDEATKGDDEGQEEK